ncbi:branched-chain amino acid ABC transporter permease [Bradyrhizobium sp. ISRA443]|uniref:branched-chain amino acid ABC transporter permease n=1 Tax=unclassified Bradyrhizobium TaxID=2631580 RepID=UPI00247B03E5|nr:MULTISPECIES: branched-chain amino acid ABC transporter permease [unclassified Bradyrhizobium]WGR92590.1 branched-chain amino acid ABC transporter permease [Bradyrhizobium sp. ISRA435]WGR97018.1 branched-chain amino acid ABC transporter permease [Bradyrhizobium sp. ISRA436]WGS03905.1 branched-chain amino acid ABC transporter permease [Bradyrhizobium sp. ISRA437]WGS10789.1 branched-chain amino acid ABC transporter permease [Bradyrhizobium sp. ISRA443]
MADLLQLAINGFAIGGVYALAAIGFVIVYETTGVVNFAAGQFVMVGTFAGVAALVNAQLPWPIAYGVALLAMAAFGALFFMLVYWPLKVSPAVTVIIGTVAISITMQNAALLVFGSWPVRIPSPVEGMTVELGGAVISLHALLTMAMTALLVGGLWVLLHRTSFGIGMRAVAQDAQAARLMGLKVGRVLAMSWVLGALLAGAAGLLLGPMWFADVNMGDPVALKAFAATIIGGFGSLPGAVLGGVFVGLSEVLGASYISSAYKDLISFGIMIAFLFVRPQGMFGERIQDRG